MSAIWAMGGYGAYVWPSYAASVLVLGVIVILSVRAHRRAQNLVRQLEDADAGAKQ